MNDEKNDTQHPSSSSSTFPNPKVKKKKTSKHALTEVSSKRSDYYTRRKNDLGSNGISSSALGTIHRYKPRDPRMHDDLSGKFNTEHFETSYAFLQERETSEIENLKKRIEARLATGARVDD